jgi:GNAT superfamily N-acetyltransferase
MIRAATHADMDRLLEMTRAFHTHAGLADLGFDVTSMQATLAQLIDDPHQVLLVAEHDGQISGMVAGVSYPAYFNHAVRMAQELFWWNRDGQPGDGQALCRALEAWAKAQGCSTLMMVLLHDEHREAIDKMYRRWGYQPGEHCYMRRLSWP